MQAYEIGEQQGIASLTRTTRPGPEPMPGEAIIRVQAACLNHRDLNIVSGTYGPRRPPARIPVSDGIGTITALGPGATGVKEGDRVICGHFASWIDGPFRPDIFGTDLGVTRDGWLAEQIAVPAAALVVVPPALSDRQAVPLGAAGLTAWNALVEMGGIKAGDLVLTLGTGGVSIFALQLAKLHGARVAITSSSDEKLEAAKCLGADFRVNYRTTPDWPQALLRQTGGMGADIVLETAGQASLTHSIAAAAPNARIVLIGALAGAAREGLPNYNSIIGKNLILRGITAGSRRMLANLVRAADTAALTPVIAREFSFDEPEKAYASLAAGENLGKVMIRF